MKDDDFKVTVFLIVFIVICFALGAKFIFDGQETDTVTSTKHADGNVVFDYTREHFWGYLKFPHHVERVKKAEIKRIVVKVTRFVTLVSAVLVDGSGQKFAVTDGSSTNIDIKSEITNKINTYLQDSKTSSFSESFRIRDDFFWIGFFFLGIGASVLIRWIKCTKDSKKVLANR